MCTESQPDGTNKEKEDTVGFASTRASGILQPLIRTAERRTIQSIPSAMDLPSACSPPGWRARAMSLVDARRSAVQQVIVRRLNGNP